MCPFDGPFTALRQLTPLRQLHTKAPVKRHRPTTRQSTSQALSTHTFYPRIESDASGRRNKRSGEKYPCEVTSEKWRQMFKEKEDAKDREDNEKCIKREEREKKRKLNEELNEENAGEE